MKNTKLTKDTQFYIRFRNKPAAIKYNNDLNYRIFKGEWVRSYKSVPMLSVGFISEASYETNWFNRNPEILKMVLTNDKDIAKKVAKHELPLIAFLANEIINGNYIITSESKIFECAPTNRKNLLA